MPSHPFNGNARHDASVRALTARWISPMRRPICAAFQSVATLWRKDPIGPVDGEALFEEWLRRHCLKYQRHHEVHPGNVDFFVHFGTSNVYCDVKEVRDSAEPSGSDIDADGHIRSDIRKLRAKFKGRPDLPVLLVTMNFSSSFFTALTVARAMLGEVGVHFDRQTLEISKPAHHLRNGNASMTSGQNRSISGVLVWNGRRQRHTLLLNPFAEHPLDGSLFPDTDAVALQRSAPPDEIGALSNRMFWPIGQGET